MNLRPRDRIALVVVVVAALIGGYYVLALKPEHKKASALLASIAGEQRQLTQAQQSYAQGKAAAASLKSNETQWNSLRLAVPSQSDIPALLRLLQKTSTAAHVNMQSITLAGTSGSTDTSATTTGATPASSGATGVPIQLTFAGGYVALNNLVRRLNGLVSVKGTSVHATGPLLSISNVSLTGAPKLTVQLSATIYQLAAATAADTTGGQG
jgi:Tfp pilus assembly protein PilO